MKFLIVFIFAVVAVASAHKCLPIGKFCKGANQEFVKCANPCPVTCENRLNPPMCRAMCRPGCYCKDGYVRDARDNCILAEKCPRVVPPACKGAHEIRTGCETDCNNMTKCAGIVPGGFAPCFCKDGYVRNNDRNCVLPEACPAIKPICSAAEHKMYSECNAHCPIKTCENPEGPMICPAICVEGCICEDGYVQDSDGNCVTQDACPAIQPVCSAHEAYTDCGTACPLTCENKDNPPMFCTANCVVGCFCNEGYVRASNGNCVKPLDCPAPEPVIPAICLLPQETGPCKAAFKKWGYNSATGCCTEFTYGGCEGNANRYDTQEECVTACS
jgi:hypothetical protein